METVAVTYFTNFRVHMNCYAGRNALPLEHGHNIVGCSVAEKLTQLLLMPGDLMLLYQFKKVRRRIASQRGLGKVRISGKKVFGSGVQVGEVAAPPTGDQDLLADPRGMFEQQNRAAAAARMNGAKKPRGAGAHNQNIVVPCGRQ